MPTYEYECKNCGAITEIFHGINENIEPACAACGKTAMQKLISSGIGVHFKGSGFYVTDKRASTSKPVKDSKKTSDATPPKN